MAELSNKLLVIVGNRFGIKSIDEKYFASIKRFMKLPSFKGLVGGKPNFAYYFVGMIDNPVGSEQS